MENLNAEQIKKDMEHCINDDCDKCSVPFGNCQANLIESALALITSQEQRIKELAEELDDAKRDTIPKLRLSLERANAMGVEADKTIEKLTEENERLHASCTEFERKCASLNDENASLRAENETLKVAINDQYAHVCDCHDTIAEMLRQKESHTVMKMHSMLCEGRVSNDNVVIVANQIAKEMVEGEK